MNAATAAEPDTMELATDHEVLLQHLLSSSLPKRKNAVENLAMVCTGAFLLTAVRGAPFDLGLAADARTALSVAACCAVLAGAASLFLDVSGSFFQRRRRR